MRLGRPPCLFSTLLSVAISLGCLFGDLGCMRGNLKGSLDRRSRGDADLVALLPRGLDAVLDVDVAGPTGLRQLSSLDDLLALLPQGAMDALGQLCDHPTLQVEALAIGISGLGTPAPQVALIVRGDLDRARVFHIVRRGSGGPVSEVEYHGLPLIESTATATPGPQTQAPPQSPSAPAPAAPWSDPGHAAAAAMLTARTAVLGSRLSTRQVIDIFRGEEEGARSQADLMAALARAPRAKTGRPAILLASLLPDSVRTQVAALGLPDMANHANFLSVAMAVGDGIDIGLVVGYRSLQAARDAVAALQTRTAELKRRPALAFVGIANFLDPLKAVAAPISATRAQPELHLAYRLPGDDLTGMLARLSRLDQLRKRLDGDAGVPPPRKTPQPD